MKRAAIQGAILAVLYFIVIQYLWKQGTSTTANLLVAIGGFFLYTGIAYAVDRFKYQRKLQKLKGSSK